MTDPVRQVYQFRCESCFNVHEMRVEVDRRDELQTCPYCGCGARRSFLPATVFLPWSFGACTIADLTPSHAERAARDRKNEEWEANRPAPKPDFEQCVKDALDERGIRRPHRLIEPDLQREMRNANPAG